MKRLAPFLLSGIILLSGCSVNPLKTGPELKETFSAETEITLGNETFKGKLTRHAENDWELKIAEPFALEGLTLTVDENGTKLSMLGMEAKADLNNNTSSAVKLITDAYDSAAAKEKLTELVNTCTNENGTYTLIFGEDGSLSELSLPDLSLTVSFSDWSEITSDTQQPADEASIE